MAPPTRKPRVLTEKRSAPAADLVEGSSSDDDDEDGLDADRLRALKRFKAGGEDNSSDDDYDDKEQGLEQGRGLGGGGQQRRQPRDDSDGRDSGGEDEDEVDEDEDEDEDGGESDDSSEDPSGGDDGDDRTLEEQVADVPFEVLEAIKRDGRGLVGGAARAAAARAAARSFKRQNKDRPQEVSSKRPVGRFREVIQVPHRESRDPRFDTSGGSVPTDSFRRRYAFLYNDMLPQEKKELQGKIKKEKNPKFKAKLQAELQRVDSALRNEDLRRRTQKLETEWKSKERTAVAGGKTPFFLKAADKKRLALLAKYQELKEHGKLDKFMEKRRKKNAAKDHRYLPSGRREQPDS